MGRQFDEELKNLKERLLEMAYSVEESITLAVQSLKERRDEPAREVLAREERINMMEIEIDDICLRLLALRQPMAVDLRFITSAKQIGSELERIGDQAVNISQRTLELLKYPQLKPLLDIPRMAEIAQKMVRHSIDAFIRGDEQLARAVCGRDDEVDQINEQIFRELLTYMTEDLTTVTRAVGLILVGRSLERIADHATNIGEDVIYMAAGRTIKHHIEEKEKLAKRPLEEG